VKRLHFSKSLNLDLDEKKILECGWTWTEFSKIRSGPGSKNLTVLSSLL